MSEIEDVANEAIEKSDDQKLNSLIALLVAISATFMAICNIKDGNIVQGMAQVQAKAVDTWTYYQAKSTKQNLAESMADQVQTQIAAGANLSAETKGRLDEMRKKYEGEAQRYNAEKEDVKKQAEDYEGQYDALNVHDDQFDMAEACLTIAIALLGVTALTKKRWLFYFAMTLSAVGFMLGLAGFLGWSFHPDWLAKLLG